MAAGLSLRALSRQLQRAPSTMSREVRRHGGRATYRASGAEAMADQAAMAVLAPLLAGRALRPGRYRLVATPRAGGRTGSPAHAQFRVVR